MSQFSGKCDLYDYLKICKHNGKYVDNLVVYVGSKKHPLVLDSVKDLIPYYPYLIATAVYDGDKHIIRLSKESYVDREEREILEYYLKYLLRIYKRCKRKHEIFDVDDAVKMVSLVQGNTDHIIELAKRVKENGTKANIEGIHIETKDWYRRKLITEMKLCGIDPAQHGYGRLIS